MLLQARGPQWVWGQPQLQLLRALGAADYHDYNQHELPGQAAGAIHRRWSAPTGSARTSSRARSPLAATSARPMRSTPTSTLATRAQTWYPALPRPARPTRGRASADAGRVRAAGWHGAHESCRSPPPRLRRPRPQPASDAAASHRAPVPTGRLRRHRHAVRQRAASHDDDLQCGGAVAVPHQCLAVPWACRVAGTLR